MRRVDGGVKPTSFSLNFEVVSSELLSGVFSEEPVAVSSLLEAYAACFSMILSSSKHS